MTIFHPVMFLFDEHKMDSLVIWNQRPYKDGWTHRKNHLKREL